MRIPLLIGCLFNFLLMAKTQTPTNAFPLVTISGEIEETARPDGMLDVRMYYDNIIDGEQKLLSSYLEPDGSFQLQFMVPFQHEIMMLLGDQGFPILVSPGEAVHLALKANKKGGETTVKISGDNATLHRWVYKYHQELEEAELISNYYDEIRERPEMDQPETLAQAFQESVKSFAREMNQFLQSFLEENPGAPDLLKVWAQNNIDYRIATDWVHTYGARPFMMNRDMETVPSFMEFIERFTIDNPSACISANYLSFINQYAVLKPWGVKPALFRSKEKDYKQEAINYIKTKITGFAQEIMLTQHFCFLTTFPEGLTFIKKELQTFDHMVKDPYLKQGFYDLYHKIVDPVLDSASLDERINRLSIPDSEKDVFAKILEEHSGKVIYLDVWGTWCGPCLGELPAYKNMVAQFDETEVAFVFLAHNSPENLWREKIVEYEVPGTHILMTNPQYRILSGILGISSFPYHAVLDQQGRIYKERAPGPGQRLVDLINGLLEN